MADTKRTPTLSKRIEDMQRGNGHLHAWLQDQIRQGLASLRLQPPQYWDDFAALMVDSKLGAIARRINKIRDIVSTQDEFEHLLHSIAELYLFSCAFRQFDDLPARVADDLLQIGGFSFKKDAVLSANGIVDYWLVTGVMESVEEKLKVRRTWLLGERSAQFALILDFAWGNQGFDKEYRVGSAFDGEVVFYPGQLALRGILKTSQSEARAFDTPDGTVNFKQLAESFSGIIARNPWVQAYPFLLNNVVPVYRDSRFELVDEHQRVIALSNSEAQSGWRTIALSGGYPVDIFGQWDGLRFEALSAFSDGRLITL